MKMTALYRGKLRAVKCPINPERSYFTACCGICQGVPQIPPPSGERKALMSKEKMKYNRDNPPELKAEFERTASAVLKILVESKLHHSLYDKVFKAVDYELCNQRKPVVESIQFEARAIQSFPFV